MAGVTQFAESEELVLDVSNALLDIAPDSYVPLQEWESTGFIGALSLQEGKTITDYNYFDLSKASESEFDKIWPVVEYTLTFARGNRSTKKEQDTVRLS